MEKVKVKRLVFGTSLDANKFLLAHVGFERVRNNTCFNLQRHIIQHLYSIYILYKPYVFPYRIRQKMIYMYIHTKSC